MRSRWRSKQKYTTEIPNGTLVNQGIKNYPKGI